MKIKRFFYLYIKYIVQYIKSVLEYPSDALIRIIATILTQISGYTALWAIFLNIPDLSEWSFWELVLIYATMYMVIGIGELIFDGTWSIAGLAAEGKFDIYLLRPFPVLFQILASTLGLQGFANLITSLVFLIQAITHLSVRITVGHFLAYIMFVATSVPLHFSLLLLGNSVALLTKQVNSGSLPTLVIKLTDFTKYPLSIYPVILQVAFTFIVPYAFVSYYPVSFLLEKNSYTWLSFLGPVISTLFFIVSIRVFEFGLEKYEGSGN